MKTTINGSEVEFAPATGKTAIDVIRVDAKLTGTKLVCGTGVCGACTVRVDGTSITSCLMPASHLDGCSVETIESVGKDGLHPVQKAFMAADGLQCGFCTPGFVVQAVAFYDEWRAAHSDGEAPARNEIASALSGHLCRCGSYVGIYDAVARACAGEFEGDVDVRAPRVDARQKVTGEARFTFDVRQKYQLEARFVRSSLAHARVLGMNWDAAMALDGVRAIVELLDPTDPVVRYVGTPIAAVAATTAEVAKQAADLIQVEYEPIPHVVDIDQALTGHPTAYEGKPKNPPNSFEAPPFPGTWKGNVRRACFEWLLGVWPPIARWIVRRADQSEKLVLVSGTYRTSNQIHTALEPHVAVAEWLGPASLEVHVSTQTVDMVQAQVSKYFGLRPDQVRVLARYVGGGFGGKQDMQSETLAAVKLARETACPVRVVNDRLEEMADGGNRPAARVGIDVVADHQGRFKALQINALGSAGTAINSMIAILARLSYSGPFKALQDRDVVTNLAPGKPFRGPYAPPMTFALESSVDQMAHRLGIDAIELRKRWDKNKVRRPLYDWASGLDAWRFRGPVAASNGRYKRGIGVAMGTWVSSYYAGTIVEVAVDGHGISVATTTQDMGQGSRTVMADTVARVFGVDPLDIHTRVGETTGLPGPASSASRTTDAIYITTKRAALAAHGALLESATRRLGLDAVRAIPGGIAHSGGEMTLAELMERVPPITKRAKRGANGLFDILGHIPSGSMQINFATTTTGSLYVAEVCVDSHMGRVEVRRMWGGIAAGHIVSHPLARSQVEGGVIQGIGYALYEERNVDPRTGTVLSAGLEEYRIPGIGDVPEMELHFFEQGFEKIKGHASGLAELSTIPVSAAIANAVHHATGFRYQELPMRPDRILTGLS